jgi:hypothetical protein
MTRTSRRERPPEKLLSPLEMKMVMSSTLPPSVKMSKLKLKSSTPDSKILWRT